MEIADIFDLRWGRDPRGHELRDSYEYEPLWMEAAHTGREYSGWQRHWLTELNLREEACIVKISLPSNSRFENQLEMYSPLQFPAIYKEYVDADTPAKMLKFVNKFGLPYSLSSTRAPWRVLDYHRCRLVAAIDSLANEALGEIKWDCERYVLDFKGQTGNWPDWPFETEDITSFSSYIKRDDSNTPRFRIRPNNLMSGMWLQLALDLERKASFKKCERCGRYFQYGAGTGRRKSAKYCQDSCRVAAYYARARENLAK